MIFVFIAECGCGKKYSTEEWLLLPLIGVQKVPGAPSLEMRDCFCGSTISVEVPREPGSDEP